MKNKLLTGIIAVIALIAFVSAAIYTEPWNTNQRGGNHNLTEMGWISANTLNGTNILTNNLTAVNLTGALNWTYLWNYPVACASGAITAINDSTTCTDAWVELAGDTMTGNLDMNSQGVWYAANGSLGLGTMSPQNVFNVIGSINQTTGNATMDMIYGEMYFHNDTTGNVTGLTEDAWANFTGIDQTDSGGSTTHSVIYLASELIIQMDGIYKANYHHTFTGTANNKYHNTLAVGGELKLDCETHDRISTGTDILSSSGTCLFSLSVGDVVTLMVMNEDSSGDSTTLSANINLFRIGN